MNELIIPDLQVLQQQSLTYIEQSKSKNTLRAYRAAWNSFVKFCEYQNLSHLPASPETVCIYLTYMVNVRKNKCSTIQQHVASISQAHQAAQMNTPTLDYRVKNIINGIEKTVGTVQKGKKGLILDDIVKLLNVIDEYSPRNTNETIRSLMLYRDRMIVLTGFLLGTRRSELANIRISDMIFEDDGIDIIVDQGKVKKKQPIFIPKTGGKYCPVKVVTEWITESGIKDGFLLRRVNRNGTVGESLGADTISETIKKYAELVGMNPDDYAGHSLRRGMATQAYLDGWDQSEIQKQLGHSTPMMTQRYIEDVKRKQRRLSNLADKLK